MDRPLSIHLQKVLKNHDCYDKRPKIPSRTLADYQNIEKNALQKS